MVIVLPVRDNELGVNKPRVEEGYEYNVSYILRSASAFVCIATRIHDGVEQTVVLKALRAYEDERYHYYTPQARLMCQKEAFSKNHKITPGIYRGLGRILQPTRQEFEDKVRNGESLRIRLENIMQDSEEIEHLSTRDGEYALIMSHLPQEQRLDHLLREENTEKQAELLRLLVKRIAEMHKDFQSPVPLEDEDGNSWGSYEQLLKKSKCNLMYFELIKQDEPELQSLCGTLRADLLNCIEQPQLRDAFKHRQANYVKQCHGDLKTKNIWVEMLTQDEHIPHYVYILDAVDFNESYRNIDVLADLAMLVVDVDAHGGEGPSVYLREEYLALTGLAQDENARTVLAYYLLEKAIVHAIVCLIYDPDERQLGSRFLELAERYACDLKDRMRALVVEKSV